MKNKNRIGTLAAALLAALLATMLFAGCENTLEPPKDKGNGGLLVSISGAEARTLAPSNLDGLVYWIIVRQSGGGSAVYNGPPSASAISLRAGSYDIYGEAYENRDSGRILVARNAKLNVVISVGDVRRETITLLPSYSSDVYGTFSYSIVYPQNLTSSSEGAYGNSYDTDRIDPLYPDTPHTLLHTARLVLTPRIPNSSGYQGDDDPDYVNPDQANVNSLPEIVELLDTAGTTDARGNLQLPPGVYDLVIELMSNRYSAQEQLGVNRREVVYIYPGRTTVADYNFTASHFTAQINLRGIVTVENNTDVTYRPDRVIIYYDGNGNNPDQNYFYNSGNGSNRVSSSLSYDDSGYVETDQPYRQGEHGNIANEYYWVNLNRSDSVHNEVANANIDPETGRWTVFLDSHLIKRGGTGTFTNAKVRFRLKNGDSNYIYSRLYDIPLVNNQASSHNPDTYKVRTTRIMHRLDNYVIETPGGSGGAGQSAAPNLPGNASVTFPLGNVTGFNGWTRVSIKNTTSLNIPDTRAYFGLIGSSLAIRTYALYNQGGSGWIQGYVTAEPSYIARNGDNISVGFNIPDAWDAYAGNNIPDDATAITRRVHVNAEFFWLGVRVRDTSGAHDGWRVSKLEMANSEGDIVRTWTYETGNTISDTTHYVNINPTLPDDYVWPYANTVILRATLRAPSGGSETTITGSFNIRDTIEWETPTSTQDNMNFYRQLLDF